MEAKLKVPTLNEEQRNAAYSIKNAVIAAGAGSGKTMVLASRYVWLITEKKHSVSEILTLTFTKKAAAEMYRRIHFLLTDIVRKTSEHSKEKKELAAKALEDFAQARIQTLDSYCASIVRQASNRYGISPDFVLEEDRCEKLAIDESLPFLIANRMHPVIKKLYNSKSSTGIAERIFASALFECTYIDKDVDPKRDFDLQSSIVSGEWDRQSEIVKKLLRELPEVYKGNENCSPGTAPVLKRYSNYDIVFPSGDELRDYFKVILTLDHNSAIDWAEAQPLQSAIMYILEYINALAAVNLSQGTPKNNFIKDILKELRELNSEFSSLGVFCLQAGLIFSMMSLFSNLQRQYLNKKRNLGILTFADSALLAKKILIEQLDIRENEKETFKAIMIDEFQDNNELQKELLFLLAEKYECNNTAIPPPSDLCPDKLFFVGDEKQSIYRFRGADVSVFRKLKDELKCKDIPLMVNYRSAPQLIGAFNTIFGGSKFDPEGRSSLAENPAVFAPALSTLPLYEASYSPLRASKTGKGKLTLCILDKADSDKFEVEDDTVLTPVENEARFVAEQISELLKEKDESGNAKYRPHDIAILFRTRTPQHLFEKHLMLLNIPYTSENLNGFFFGGLVNDLMSVLRLAAYPSDRAAYGQMLRSPFVGISIPGLAVCINCLESGEPFDDEPLALLPELDKEKYRHGQIIYSKILEMSRTKNICSILNELWYGLGYRYETEWNHKTTPYRELYDYLFHLAAISDKNSETLAAFTDYIHKLSLSEKKLDKLEIPLERASAVNLITMHKSKGLEYPVVFLCCCHKTGQNDSCEDIYDTEEFGFTMNPPFPPELESCKKLKHNYFWERAHAIRAGKTIAEQRRLLYVAMTRAENELYLTGSLDLSKGKSKGEENYKDKDFSLQVKQLINYRIKEKKGKADIPGDSILTGSHFFGLCLPAFGAHIPDDPGTETFFNIKEIPIYSEQYMRKAEQHSEGFSNDQKGLNSFFKMVETFYKDSEIIETPVVSQTRFAPTSLPASLKETSGTHIKKNSEYSGKNAENVFIKTDKLLGRYGDLFSSADFGTLVHICLEAILTGKEAVLPPKFAGSLSPADGDVFLDAGKKLADLFIRSPLGVKAEKAGKRHSEFRFRSLLNTPDDEELFITGTIDLVFEDEEGIWVVDFKTDREENPEQYIPQMACYHKAVSDLFAAPGKDCRILLYYLRSGNAVEVTWD
ncbi:MAG: UvrD-helicase domain-containing protein [Treponema sp.]|nr:UvrD-helicase domain-containing protein [Treponema sp.]